MPVVATLTVDLVARTASFDGPMENSPNKARKSAKDIQDAFNKMDFSEARGGLMLIDDLIGIHMPRHAAAFVSQIPGITAAFNAMFPVAAIAVAVKAIDDAFDAAKRHHEELLKEADASMVAAAAIGKHAEALHIGNLKLEDRLALLHHQIPQNGVAIAMADGKTAVDALIVSLEKAIETEAKLEKGEQQGFLNRLVFGDNGSAGMATKLAQFDADVKELQGNIALAESRSDALGTAIFRHELQRRLDSMKDFVAQQRKAVQDASDAFILKRVGPETDFDRGSTARIIAMQYATQLATEKFKDQNAAVDRLETAVNNYGRASAQIARSVTDNVHVVNKELSDSADQETQRLNRMSAEFSKREFEHRQLVLKRAEAEAKMYDEGQAALAKMLNAESAGDARKAAADSQSQQRSDAILQLMREISDQDAVHSARMAVATGHMTEQQATLQALNTLENNKSVALKAINLELDAQIVKVKALSAATFGGMSGTEDQKAEFRRATDEYQKMEERKLQITKQFNAQISAEQLKLANNEHSQWRKMALDFQQTMTHMSQFGRQTLGQLNSSLAQFVVTGQGNFRQLEATAIESFIEMALQYVESKLIMIAMDKLFGSDGKDSLQKQKEKNAALASSSAALAGANTLAITSAEYLPPTPEILAGVAYGMGMGFSAAASASRGAILPNREMLVHTHPEEMILPQHIANFVVGAADRASGDGGGDVHHHYNVVYSPSIQAVDAAGVERMLDKHSAVFTRKIHSTIRRMNY